MTANPVSTAAEAEVLAAVARFNRAFADNDPDAYFRLMDPDLVVLTPGSPYRVEGVAADRAEFEDGLRSGRTTVHFFQELQPRVRVWGDVAVVTYYSRGRYGADDGTRVHHLKETDVLVRREGEWRIVHIHVSGTG